MPSRIRIAEAVHTIVDDDDLYELSQYAWRLQKQGYAARQQSDPHRLVLMSRHILGLRPGDGLQADHINGDRLDNRRSNLRVVTSPANHQNVHKPFRGTRYRNGRWEASAMLNKRHNCLGSFDTRELAASAASAWRATNMPYSLDAMQAQA